MKKDSSGSTWRKWDLHVHTPASIEQHYGGDNEAAWEKFFSDLENLPSSFKVIGINDYIFIDGYEKVLEAQRKHGRLKNIDLILPVIEYRLDKFGGIMKMSADGSTSRSDSSRINLHVIFDQLEPQYIRDQFISGISRTYRLIPEANEHQGSWSQTISRESVSELGTKIIESMPEELKKTMPSPLKVGFNNLCISLENVEDIIKSNNKLKGNCILALGKTEWADIKWNDQSIAEKKHIIQTADIIFTASSNPDSYKKSREKLISENVNSKLLDCSDAHNFSTSNDKDRIGKCLTWIKADTTFQGLKQAIYEFDQRVFIGDGLPPKPLLTSTNRTKYISSISINPKKNTSPQEIWFQTKIALNHDLVAIIGNKGSGKSALADAIALAGNTQNYKHFSFLTEKRFRNPKSKISDNFISEIEWHDNTVSQKSLGENPVDSNVERVKYLPQSYLEELCNEFSINNSTVFDKELRKIIYTHIPKEERFNSTSLDELLQFKISALTNDLETLSKDLSEINSDIFTIEQKMTPLYKQTLQEQYENKQKELGSLLQSKPALVEDPGFEESQDKSKQATLEISELEKQLQNLQGQEDLARRTKTDTLKSYTHITSILQLLKNYRESHKRFIENIDTMINEIHLPFNSSDLISIKIDTSILDQHGSKFAEDLKKIDEDLDETNDASILNKKTLISEKIKTIKGQLDEKQRVFLEYKEQVTLWEQAQKEIIGDENKVNSIKWYEFTIPEIEHFPQKREAFNLQRLEILKKIYENIGHIMNTYKNIYEPVQRFVQTLEQNKMYLPLNFDVRIVEEGFQEQFLRKINRQVRGSFYGVEESDALVKNIIQETDFMNVNSVVAFIEKINDLLHFDRRPEKIGKSEAELDVAVQIKKGNTVKEIYDYLFSLTYLKPRYSLTYGDQEISQLSPGERGLLLLVFYLLVDKNDIPLVIDQPEENLDNQTIYKILVSCIKEAKKRRQIIMVTHNPNLAVVCDAEQIIHATCDKTKKRFHYVSGSIEDPAIKKLVVEILEGTKPAFENRKTKYGIS